MDPITNMPIVILKNSSEDRVLPIWVGVFEANAIAMQLEKILAPRPMTHDLMGEIIVRLHGELERIVISDLKDHTFYAKLVLRANGELIEVDSRPSDAIALGVATETPIYVNDKVLDEVCQ